MADSNIRAALRSMTPEDVPFIQDLLERLSGKKWRVAPNRIPSIEEIMMHGFTSSVNDVLTLYYKGKRASARNTGFHVERRLAQLIQEQY